LRLEENSASECGLDGFILGLSKLEIELGSFNPDRGFFADPDRGFFADPGGGIVGDTCILLELKKFFIKQEEKILYEVSRLWVIWRLDFY
jgi:hypothetical protein